MSQIRHRSSFRCPASPKPIPAEGNLNRRAPYAAGFTLFELLVVIAIIAILASLMMPALGRARDVADKAACTGNLRQISIGLFLYADEADVWLPINRWEWPSNGGGSWD